MDFSSIWTAFSGALIADLPALIAICFAGGLLYWIGKNPASKLAMYEKQYSGLAIQALRWVEKNYSTSTNPTISKADLALQKFTDFFEAHTGDTPDEEVKAWFKVAKEEILLDIAKATNPATK